MVKIEVSIGELVDKITILEIKREKIKDQEKLTNINNELSFLTEKLNSLSLSENIFDIKNDLKQVNTMLWEVEDRLREFERDKNFSKEFIEDARSVYKLNDQRFSFKKKINVITNSQIVEEKSYKEY